MRRFAAIAAALAIVIIVAVRPATGQNVTIDDRVAALETRVAELTAAVHRNPIDILVPFNGDADVAMSIGPGNVELCTTALTLITPIGIGRNPVNIPLVMQFDPNTASPSILFFAHESGCQTILLSARHSLFHIQADGASWGITIRPKP